MDAGPQDVPPPDRGWSGAARPKEWLAVDDRDPGGRGGPNGRGGADGRPADDRGGPDERAARDGHEEPGGSVMDAQDPADGPDAPADSDAPADPAEEVQSFRELRPVRRLRVWQLAPVVALGALGSLMFAFPLAFEFGDGGAVVAMLGLLLCCSAAGWGIMAARRVGYTWPGLPARGSGERPDWRFVALYAVLTVVLVGLAVWRVARLR
jgi:hypothetical protein